MSQATIYPGICGFITTVEVHKIDKRRCSVKVQSECPHIQKLAVALTEVEPFKEISFRGDGPSVLRLGAEYCTHPACPVPVGILKAIEVEAGLALPRNVEIKVEK